MELLWMGEQGKYEKNLKCRSKLKDTKNGFF